MLEQLGAVQLALREEDLVGWLLMSAGGQNPIAERLLGVDGALCRRRWFYWIPANGIPALLVPRAELGRFPSLPGESLPYASWPELRDGLARVLPGRGRIAMEYAPMGIDAQLSRVDAGTMELVRSYGPFVVGSESIVRRFTTQWSKADLDRFEESAGALSHLLGESFDGLREAIAAGAPPTEGELVGRVEELAAAAETRLNHEPRIAFGENTADPTYVVSPEGDRRVAEGDLVQITLGGGASGGPGVEAGACAFVGASAPAKITETHALVHGAAAAAFDLIRRRTAARRRVLGFEVDRAVRDVFAGAGLADAAPHRSGHGVAPRGDIASGTQLDSLETHDVRPIEPGYVFALHPGLYRGDFGLRLTTCFHVTENSVIEVAPDLDSALRMIPWITDH